MPLSTVDSEAGDCLEVLRLRELPAREHVADSSYALSDELVLRGAVSLDDRDFRSVPEARHSYVVDLYRATDASTAAATSCASGDEMMEATLVVLLVLVRFRSGVPVFGVTAVVPFFVGSVSEVLAAGVVSLVDVPSSLKQCNIYLKEAFTPTCIVRPPRGIP